VSTLEKTEGKTIMFS